MKNNLFFSILILMFFTIACEKSEVQKSTTSTVPIHNRFACPIDDCEDCPVNDCCCAVELVAPSGGVQLHFCGTSSPCASDQPCFAGGLDPNCPDISGFVEYITLTPGSPRALFCVPQNSPFGIVSTFPSTSMSTVRINCRLDQIPGQWDTIQLNTPPDKPFWETGNDCSLTPCL